MRPSQASEGRRAPFDPLTIFLHWLVAILIGIQAASGLAVHYVPESGAYLLDLHRSSGAIIWTLAILRLVWRSTFARFPPFPARMPKVQQWFAKTSERLLYALLLIVPLAGFAMSLARGKPFALIIWTVPALFPRDLDVWLLLLQVHRNSAYALLALAGGHALMALTHHYLLRDDILVMMAPWLKMRVRRSATVINLSAAARESAPPRR